MSTDTVQRLKDFAKIWNAHRAYVSNIDLERAFNKSIRVIRKEHDAYNTARIEHPELPELIWRRAQTGQAIPVPGHALRQLDPFRIDPDVVRTAPGIIVTSAQFGATLHKGFWDTLNVLSEYRDFPLVVMPIKYGPVQFIGGRYTSTFPDELMGHVIFEDLLLGKDQLQLNVMRMRPTLERFLTAKVCQQGGGVSQIFAAPVIELEHRQRVAAYSHPYPKACMTTGAVTIPNYTLDKLGQQDRTAEVAIDNHTFGAVIIEFTDKAFHFRQLIANKRGEFYDIDPVHGGARWFTSKGHEHRPDDIEGLVCGDWHTGKTCPTVRKVTFGNGGMAQTLNPQNVVLHDFIDGDSVSHYEEKQASRRAWKAPKGYDSMETELKQGVAELNWIQSQVPKAKLNVVASNHPEFITEYVEKMKWAKDDINLAFGARLFSTMVAGLEKLNPIKVRAKAPDPVVTYLQTACPDVNVMERTDKLLLGNSKVLCSMHGDIGMRGAPTRSLIEFLNMNVGVILGHNHTGTILGPAMRVGTSTPRMQFYVTTPATPWTNSHAAVFKNGQRLLMNIIGREWHGYTLPNHK